MEKAILKATIFTPFRGVWGLPVICWGTPGTAKTAYIEEICNEFSMPYETLSPSERGEGAFGVVPVPDGGLAGKERLMALSDRVVQLMNGKRKMPHEEAFAKAMAELPSGDMILRYPPPDWVHKFIETKRGVVFVDEITTAAPALQAPLMGLVHARRIGGYRFEPGVRVIGAANPPEMAAGGFDLSPPLANRFGHLEWAPPSPEEHVQFMLRGRSGNEGLQDKMLDAIEGNDQKSEDLEEKPEAFDAEAEESRIMKAWPNAWARAVGLETAFIRARGGSLKNKMPDANTSGAGRAWPSDRTWDMATHAYASGFVHNLSKSEHEKFVEAFIGAGVGQEWFGFMEKQDLPDPAALLDGKIQFKHESTRIDRTVAVLQSCVALVAPKSAIKRQDRGVALWNLIEKMADQKSDLDVIVPTVQTLIDVDLCSMSYSGNTLAKINPVLKKAGINAGRRR